MSAMIPVFSVFNSGPFEGTQFWQTAVPMESIHEYLSMWAGDKAVTIWVNADNRKQIVVNGAIPGVTAVITEAMRMAERWPIARALCSTS